MTRDEMLETLRRLTDYAYQQGQAPLAERGRQAEEWLKSPENAEWCSAGVDNFAGYHSDTHGWVLR